LSSAVSVSSGFWVSTTSVTSSSLSSQAYSAVISPGLFTITSGTTPVCIAATIFWRCGANGVMLRSIVLPLAFS
jgi:hypothetical protein